MQTANSPTTAPTQQFASTMPMLCQRVDGTERIAFRMNTQGEPAQVMTNDAVYDRVAWYAPVPVQLALMLGTIAAPSGHRAQAASIFSS